jgi:23S rRNA (adenine1618-N6)-methyltransferase
MKNTSTEKTILHPRNHHRFGYDFELLTQQRPDLKKHVFTNTFGTETIDFANPKAVKALNKALLITYYDVQYWDIPQNYLCPPIPGRADYIHYIADLLATVKNPKFSDASAILGLDIGVGANCIYPILGNALYGWSFVATDIDKKALQNCISIIEKNEKLSAAISLQLQPNPRFIFKDIVLPEDRFAFSICNPPFHASQEEAAKSTIRKVNNLQNTRTKTPVLNFAGQHAELWCDGGELKFITQMIYESAKHKVQIMWFTTLVSKQAHLEAIYKTLEKVNAERVETIEMAQGQKTSRIVAWSFLTKIQQEHWIG